MKKTLIFSVLVGAAIWSLGGCARNISSGTYDAKTLGSASETYSCVVVDATEVTVEEGERLEDNKTGGIMGAVAGGVLGNAVGGGRGRTLTTALGALGGAAAGAYAEKSLKTQKAIQYIVKLDSGGQRTVVQSDEKVLKVGDAAYLIIDPKGRSRVIPRQPNRGMTEA